MIGETDAEGGTPRKVFLSYARADVEAARKVVALLEGGGFDVWWDGLIEGGATYQQKIEEALDSADCVVVLWSTSSVDSHWVRDEAESGRERHRLVPLSLDGTMPPLGFRQVQMIDVSRWNGRPNAPEAERILLSVSAQCSGKLDEPHHPVATAPLRHGVSRRALIAGVVGMAGVAALGAWQAGLFPIGDSDSSRISMAVLPFANLSGDEDQAWFSSGLSNELRAVLSRNPRLRVSAPTTSNALDEEGADEFAEAKRLGVDNILRGSVQLAGETMRISAEVVQISDGLVRWADTFDRALTDIFELQSDIARTVALSLIQQIASEEEARESLAEQQQVGGTDDVAAYEAYLRGHAFYDLSAGVESDRAALAQFDAAIVADPAYAAAHAMRATMLAAVANATTDASEIARFYDQSIAAAQRSIELEPRLAIGHLALGFALNNGRLDRKRARPHYEKARELAPQDADILRSAAIFFGFGPETKLARQMIDDAIALDPLNARAYRTAGYVAYMAHDYPLVISRMEEALALNPKLASAYNAIGAALYAQGRYDKAIAAFEAEPVAIFKHTGLAITKAAMGDKAGGETALQAVVDEYGDAATYQQAQIFAQWGDGDTAMEKLEQAVAGRDPGVLLALNDPMLEPLRGRPDFARLLRRLTS
ncbi:TIR domain-containing protein [Qipengyuania sp. 6B39]|uniref:TIR domain-containing protein n=1 Tax=Qipengyuania proteolytica TaxID=2867239 RepID=UPI001C8A7E6F|nr:TIR domain-containing protein [Qipengyuania proteolytica]